MKDYRVDRPSRDHPSSPSASPPGASRHARGRDRDEYSSRHSHHPRRRASRSRSRSPYRRRSPPRGEKRRRDDDREQQQHKDGRTFKVHYEDPRRSRISYADLDQADTVDGARRDDRYREDRRDADRRRHSRTRSRSRSPYSARQDAQRRRDDRPRSRGDSPPRKRHAKTVSFDAEAQRNGRMREAAPTPLRQADLADQVGANGHDTTTSATAGAEDVQQEPEIDEAAQIEARRKRREALKAKLKSQPTPLLAQALNVGGDLGSSTPRSEADSPALSRSASPAVGSPRSPNVDSPAFSIERDEDLANTGPGAERVGDESSAADYDPTADMREEQARHDKRLVDAGTDVSASDYKEQNETHDILMPDAKVEAPEPKKKDEFDMFADDDDDDDMFAEPTDKPASKGNAQPKELAANLLDNWDDPDGYYRIILGELLDGRYHVQANLGKGMFSAVVRATDNTTGGLVAIKIIRANETMKKAGLKEIDILNKLSAADPDNKKHVIRLERHFEHKGHLCMVFENLSINLREVLKKFGRDVGINLKAIRSYATQMFHALALLRKCNILHADIKPDNILVNDSRNMLKICDLGSAGDASENDITPYLVSRFYRAPEIILGMPYDFAIDTWSIGCTLYELYTGKILFTGRSNNQMLRAMMECRGKFSLKMLKKSEFAGMHFDDKLNFMSHEKDRVTGKDVVRLQTFLRPTRDLKQRLMGAAKGLAESEVKELNLFVDLLDRCLALNPERRLTPAEALKHPFIARGKV